MAKQLSWRVAPELRFILDTSVDQAQRIADALAADADAIARIEEANAAADAASESNQ